MSYPDQEYIMARGWFALYVRGSVLLCWFQVIAFFSLMKFPFLPFVCGFALVLIIRGA